MTDLEKIAHARKWIDKNGGYQSTRTGVEKLAHDSWVKTNSWNLSRDDFIRLSYFNGNLEDGSDGTGPANGGGNLSSDCVYQAPEGSWLTRSMVTSWLDDWSSFYHGYGRAMKEHFGDPS
jgi:hypothetical protein